MAAPSSVPSWWGFNQSVLAELRSRFLSEHEAPVRAAQPLARLSLDRLDVSEFSQLVSDSFAGWTWFEPLAALEGRMPNANHRTLANWAAKGGLAAVLTTNFDTLLERAFADMGVAHTVLNTLADPPPGGATPVPIVKLHGTSSRGESLVDLASQKRRGLPEAWLNWLQETFAFHPVVVAGFSGEDLGLGNDYLRLRAAAPRTPLLRWLHRPGQRPSAPAREVVGLGGARSTFMIGNLPDAWPMLGAPPLPEGATRDGSLGDDADVDVSPAIRRWLDNPMVDADTCGIALSRLLDAAGWHAAAQALRTSILARVRRKLRAGVGLTQAARAALQIGQLAGDEPAARAESALYCLSLSLRALDAVVERFEPEVRHRSDIEDELAHDRATIYGNIANIEAVRGHVREATAAAESARQHANRLSGARRTNHDAAYLEVGGALALLAGDLTNARNRWEAARELSTRTGNVRRVQSITRNLDALHG